MKKRTPSRFALPAVSKTTPLDERLAELRTRRGIVLEQLISLEQGGAKARDAASGAIERMAGQLLGDDSTKAVATSFDNIDELRLELDAIDRALREGGNRRDRIMAERYRAAVENAAGDWREIIHETAATICTLRRLNRLRAEFAHALADNGLHPGLTCARPYLFGDGSGPRNEATEFIAEAVEAGIVTPGEIEKWMESER